MIPQVLAIAIMILSGIGIFLLPFYLLATFSYSLTENPSRRRVITISVLILLLCLVIAWGAVSFSGGYDQQQKEFETEDYRYKYVPGGSYLGVSYPGIHSKDEIIEELEQKGLFGRHTLKVQFYNSGVSGDFQANFLSGTSGTVKTRGKLQFAWLPEGSDEVMYTNSFPARKIKFVKVEESAKPTIRFKFNLNPPELEEKMKEKGTNLGELINEKWIDYMVVRRPSDLKITDLFRL